MFEVYPLFTVQGTILQIVVNSQGEMEGVAPLFSGLEAFVLDGTCTLE